MSDKIVVSVYMALIWIIAYHVVRGLICVACDCWRKRKARRNAIEVRLKMLECSRGSDIIHNLDKRILALEIWRQYSVEFRFSKLEKANTQDVVISSGSLAS